MYLPLNIYLNRSSYYEELLIELFEITRKKKEIYRKYDSLNDLSMVDESDIETISCLINTEFEILQELLRGNDSSAQDFGFIKSSEKKI